ncbi:predicted protein [Bathycoccus prasinos]|uniref:Exportin-1/Importin-beta-like domain-containing protein n=1 Tax=Bathycoccus prasinos TaxID=41875 RepID=K8FCR9_9CHLO|nr:predicted protein [Bathycoccus prasinos]CCO19788.1 predicted protein [Bathycoccus prasinos]|eukprot:XP_007509331.1 predicted protein [Bathycoccus prasinos]
MAGEEEEKNNHAAEVAYARLVSHFSHHHRTTNDNTREDDQVVARMHSLSQVLEEFTGPVERRTVGVRSVVCIAKKLIERGGDEENNVEKRHFGYSILQRLLISSAKTSSEEEEIFMKNEFTNIISNELRLTSRDGAKVPYPLKSKVAQITAEFIKREGSTAWIAFSETIARMLRSADAYECELGAIIARYVAEDVALHSDEVFADKVRDLLGGITQTIGEVTGAMREAWERHFSNNNVGAPEMQKASENCALAVLEAISVYAEWAPLVPLVRSGLVDICCVALLVRLLISLLISRFSLLALLPMMMHNFWINHLNIHREDKLYKNILYV